MFTGKGKEKQEKYDGTSGVELGITKNVVAREGSWVLPTVESSGGFRRHSSQMFNAKTQERPLYTTTGGMKAQGSTGRDAHTHARIRC